MKNILVKCDRVHFALLEENPRKAIAISTGDSGEAQLWVGTACGLSCYRY